MEKLGKALIFVPLLLLLVIHLQDGNCQPQKPNKLSDSSSSSTGTILPHFGNIKEIFTVQNVSDFEDKVLSSIKPVVAFFYVPWCGPCRQLMPRLEEAVRNIEGNPSKLDLAKVNLDTDQLPQVATAYNVRALPTVLAFRGGQVVDQFVGNQDESYLRSFLIKLLQ